MRLTPGSLQLDAILVTHHHLAPLPGETRVCRTHEYTLSNLKFALAVEPGNLQLVHYNERFSVLATLRQWKNGFK